MTHPQDLSAHPDFVGEKYPLGPQTSLDVSFETTTITHDPDLLLNQIKDIENLLPLAGVSSYSVTVDPANTKRMTLRTLMVDGTEGRSYLVEVDGIFIKSVFHDTVVLTSNLLILFKIGLNVLIRNKKEA